MRNAFAAIHGHFYQPPRENPWLEAIETEESAAPFHDWNERVAFECYRPNSNSRIVDGRGKILDIANNYGLISFNFGPTLFPWLEKKYPSVYRKIIEADRAGMRRFGHGNAIAQTYDHLIMPLANDRDRDTEVLWGIADFQKRFSRRPEAMWLPETAVNYATLDALVRHGMRYVILSPFQARRVKPHGLRGWTDVSNGRVDPTQPYRCFVRDPSGKKIFERFIDIFFYDGVISKDVSFGDLLRDGNAFSDRFCQAVQGAKRRAQLIHIATDGETYGHHKKFGDMALAYALKEGFRSRGIELINHAAFLDRFPPVLEVEINEGPQGEGTSWSCAHGVERWKDNCGCSTGAQAGWNQKWRKPLRESLDFLRDELAVLFEQEGEKLFKNVWEARNDYIHVILDRSPGSMNTFFQRHEVPRLSDAQRVTCLKLLEMQRHALQMFTSCGWFFADVSGIETLLILQRAARAIELAHEVSERCIEEPFLQRLSGALSNLPELGRGDEIYRKMVKPKCVSLEKVVNHYAVSSVLEDQPSEKKIFSYSVKKLEYDRLEQGNSFVILGRVNVNFEIISEPRDFTFALIPSREDLFRSWVVPSEGCDPGGLRGALGPMLGQDEETISKGLMGIFGRPEFFTIRDVFKEEKQAILQRMIRKEVEEHDRQMAELYDKTRSRVSALAKEGLEIPYLIRLAAEAALSSRLVRGVEELRKQFDESTKGRIDRLLAEAKAQGYVLKMEEVLRIMGDILKQEMEKLDWGLKRNHPSSSEFVKEAIDVLDTARQWGWNIPREESQDRMAEMLREYVGRFEMSLWGDGTDGKPFPPDLVALAEKLDFNVDRFLVTL